MKTLPLASCLAVLALLAVRVEGDELRRVPFHRFGIASDSIGLRNLVLADLTGDTRPEIVSCSAEAPLALGYSAGSYVSVWHGPAINCVAAAVGDATGDGAADIITVNVTASGYSITGGTVMVFDPRGFGGPRLTATLPDNKGGSDVAFGNVDFDTAPEIVVTTVDATYVYDARTLALQWEATGYGGHEVVLGDIDGDARLEIIVNDDYFGAVLDGGNEVLKWGYAGGFGQVVLAGNVDGDQKAEIVFPEGDSTYTDIVILNGDFTESRIPYDGFPVAIGDADGNGVNEIITDAYFSGLKGLSPSTGSPVWTLSTPETGVFGNAAVGDVDGDGAAELVYGAGTDSYRDILIVAHVPSQTIEHESLDLDGALHSATADLDGDGRPELVIASLSSRNGYEGGIVQIVDPVTHAIEGTLSRTGLTYFDINRIAIGQLDNDAALEIVALGDDFYDPLIVVWDAATRQIQWQSPDSGYGNPTFLYSDMAVANVDGDARDEIVLGMSDHKLVVLDGATSVIQSSQTLDGYLAAIALADVDSDGTLEAVVGTDTTLYVLDTADWSVMEETPLPSIKQVAATAAGGGRIAVSFEENYSYGRVRLYDVGLTPFWTCSLINNDYVPTWPLVFAQVGEETRLIGGTGAGNLVVFPIDGGVSCPESSTIEYSTEAIADLHSVDVTGDGKPELVVDTRNAVEVDLIGLSTESRGDADGDGGIDGQDVDVLVDTLFGSTPGVLAAADVNADERISPEDAFALIHFEYGGGPEPQP